MNNITLIAIAVWLATGILLSACGPSQAEINATATQAASDVFATQTALAPTDTPTPSPTPSPTATPTVTPTQTRTATVTPTPTPRLMAAALRLDDLPPGFEAAPPDVLESTAQKLPENWINFAYANQAGSQLVMGFLMPWTTRIEQQAFDNMLPEMMEAYAAGFGAQGPPEELAGLEDVGDARAASTFVTETFEGTLRWDIAIFRRGEVGLVLLVAHPDEEDPSAPLENLARLMDRRFGELQGLEVAPLLLN